MFQNLWALHHCSWHHDCMGRAHCQLTPTCVSQFDTPDVKLTLRCSAAALSSRRGRESHQPGKCFISLPPTVPAQWIRHGGYPVNTHWATEQTSLMNSTELKTRRDYLKRFVFWKNILFARPDEFKSFKVSKRPLAAASWQYITEKSLDYGVLRSLAWRFFPLLTTGKGHKKPSQSESLGRHKSDSVAHSEDLASPHASQVTGAVDTSGNLIPPPENEKPTD